MGQRTNMPGDLPLVAQPALTVWAIVPVKRFGRAKSRLAPLMGLRARSAFAEALMCDVVATLTHCDALAGVLVVTADPRAATIARDLGAEVHLSKADRGVNAAVREGAAVVRDLASRILIAPIDVPLVRAEDISALVAEDHATDRVALVSAVRDGGTNALVVPVNSGFRFQFGPNSAARHVAEARRVGLPSTMADLPRLGFDIDDPADVHRLAAARGSERTAAGMAALQSLSPWRVA